MCLLRLQKPWPARGRMPFHSRFCRFTMHVHVRDLCITVPCQHTLKRFWAWILTPIVNEKHSMTSKGPGFHPSFFRLWSLQSLVVCSKSGGCRAVKSYGNFIQLCDKLLLSLFKPCVWYSYVYNAYSTVIYIFLTRLVTESNLKHRNTRKLLKGLETYPGHYVYTYMYLWMCVGT